MNHKTQEDYFKTLTTRYHALAGPQNVTPEISMASLPDSLPYRSIKILLRPPNAPMAAQMSASTPGMPPILMAMRKLREAIVASSRADDFAKTSVYFHHPYHDSPWTPRVLSSCFTIFIPSASLVEERGGNGIDWLLHSGLGMPAAGSSDLFPCTEYYDHGNRRVHMVLRALVHGNWVLFEQAKASGSDHEKTF